MGGEGGGKNIKKEQASDTDRSRGGTKRRKAERTKEGRQIKMKKGVR